jgi:hypothetical protein
VKRWFASARYYSSPTKGDCAEHGIHLSQPSAWAATINCCRFCNRSFPSASAKPTFVDSSSLVGRATQQSSTDSLSPQSVTISTRTITFMSHLGQT